MAKEIKGTNVPAAVETNNKMQTALGIMQGFAVNTAAMVFETKATELKAATIAADNNLKDLFEQTMPDEFKEKVLRGVNPDAYSKITGLKARAEKLKGATNSNAVGLIKEIFAEYAAFGTETKNKLVADFGNTVEDAHKAYNEYAKLNTELPSQLADFFENATVNSLSDIEQLATMGNMQYQVKVTIPETQDADGKTIPASESVTNVQTDAKLFGMLKTILDAEYPQLSSSVVRFVKSKTVAVGATKAPKEVKLDENGNVIESKRERKPYDPNSPKTELVYKIEVLGADGSVVKTFERTLVIQDGFKCAERSALKQDMLNYLRDIKLTFAVLDSDTKTSPLQVLTANKETGKEFYSATVKFFEGKPENIKVKTPNGVLKGVDDSTHSGIETGSNLQSVLDNIGGKTEADRYGFIFKQAGFNLRLSINGEVKGTSK